jgi:hypothetical protein
MKVSTWMRMTFVIPLLLIAACGYKPNLLPVGAPEIVKQRWVRVIAGAVDYPIVMTVQQGQNELSFHWMPKGELDWGERPGNTAAQWRFVLSTPGVPDPLCDTGWKTESPTGNHDMHEEKCQIKVDNYLAMPLLGELNYRLAGEPTGENDEYRIVKRVYYLIPQKK